MGLLVDTSIIVEIERRGDAVESFVEGLKGEDAAISSITASELLAGVSRATPEGRRAQREAFVEYVLQRLPVFSVDLAVARAHAQIWAQLSGAGQMIGLHELIIAATALRHGYDLMTQNVREFQRVPGLIVRQPEQ